MIAVFLGAGFSCIAGVPLAAQLFDDTPDVDRVTRQQLVKRVREKWLQWRDQYGGQPEEYLAVLQQRGGRSWEDATWYVALSIALKMGAVERIGFQKYLKITRHNLNRTTQIPSHENFWTAIFRRSTRVGVLTTNYDILAERGLRTEPRPRVPRPGFNYGEVGESLAGGGYPSYSHIRKIRADGSVPLLKLHGSVSWAVEDGRLVRYHDCRPAIRGDAAIVAPVITKSLPGYLRPIWDHAARVLTNSETWIVIGYSLPHYDQLIRRLLASNVSHCPTIAIFDPNPDVSKAYQEVLPGASVLSFGGLPGGLADLRAFLASRCGE